MSGSAQVQAGTKAAFVVWVWSTGGAAADVTVTTAVASAKNVGAPSFTVCPQTGTATCTLGSLPASQADELEVAVPVAKTATAGETVKLTATAKGKAALTDSVAGALKVTTTPPAAGSGAPAQPVEPVPTFAPISLQPITGLPGLPGVSVPGGTAGLFPTVSPAPAPGTSSPGPGIGFPPARKAHRSAVTTASSIVPLSSRLIGGQLAGLVVLATAVAIAIARLSLRRPRPQDSRGSGSS